MPRIRRLSLAALLILGMALATSMPSPSTAAGPNQFSSPTWFPLRGSWVVGCTWNNGCDGGYHGYAALDIARNPSGSIAGDPVYAAGAGYATVISTGSTCGGSGTPANAVQVDHGGGVVSVYFHLSGFTTGLPKWVDQNTVIGYVGHTGYVDPCSFNHLHFEVRRNGTRVSPGQLQACHGGQLVTYPAAINASYADWNQVPRWSSISNDGTSCSSGLLRSVGSGGTQCMDLASYATGTAVTLYPCYSGTSNQWSLPGDGTIRSVGSGSTQCMDLTSYATGTAVTLYPCYSGTSNQWSLPGDGTIRSVVTSTEVVYDLLTTTGDPV